MRVDDGGECGAAGAFRTHRRHDGQKDVVRVGVGSDLCVAAIEISAERGLAESCACFVAAIANRLARLIDGGHGNANRIEHGRQNAPHRVAGIWQM